ncbi:unnamed protein product [Prorocentrum cordatum]|uniref:RNA-directed DNA polymerase n=1 Tax=Prorocentrum cordatum TaxID=2364126 RepID=A0ABN9P946_9DINO|nr:unnamed protein product [Polarella glacialis]
MPLAIGGLVAGGPPDADGDDHIAVPPPLALPAPAPPARLDLKRRTPELMSHARSKKMLLCAQSRESKLRQDFEQLKGDMHTACTLIPACAQLFGRPVKHVGRIKKDDLRPAHFIFLSRIVFARRLGTLNIGIDIRRLVCAAARVIKARQDDGVEHVLRGGEKALQHPGASNRFVHMSYAHLWDEVNCKFAAYPKMGCRRRKTTTSIQTICQRGYARLTLANHMNDKSAISRSFCEQILVNPMKVSGTSANAILPAVLKAIPRPFQFNAVENIDRLLRSFSSFTMSLTGDKASGNILLMKQFCHQWETMVLPRSSGRLLVFPETCGVHLEHRTKLQVVPLKHHTMRLFSLANLLRLDGVRTSICESIEVLVQKMLKRRVLGPPPDGIACPLSKCINVLFRPDADHHKRANGKVSRRVQDLGELMRMVNGDLHGDWVHYCWDESTGRPCCRDADTCYDRTVRSVTNALYGGGDPIPAESRWTHTLVNMKQLLLRRIVYNIGVKAFPCSIRKPGAASEMPQSADGEACQSHVAEVNASRLSRVGVYFDDPKTFPELALLTVSVDIIDRWDLRYSSWPYPLFTLCSAHSSEEQRRDVARRLLDASREELGVYACGVKHRFNTVPLLMSEACRKTLLADFRTFGFSTDIIERLNAEIQAGRVHRAPGRVFGGASREQLLQQALAVHKK